MRQSKTGRKRKDGYCVVDGVIMTSAEQRGLASKKSAKIRSLDDVTKAQAAFLRDKSHSYSKIANLLGISKSSAHRILNGRGD